MKRLVVSVLIAVPLFADSRQPCIASLFDDFTGKSQGIVHGVTFTSDTAVFDSPGDGIEYSASLFPAEGGVEIAIRVENELHHEGHAVILDSAGADARVAGDSRRCATL